MRGIYTESNGMYHDRLGWARGLSRAGANETAVALRRECERLHEAYYSKERVFRLTGEMQVDGRSNPEANTVEARFGMKGGPRTEEEIIILDEGRKRGQEMKAVERPQELVWGVASSRAAVVVFRSRRQWFVFFVLFF